MVFADVVDKVIDKINEDKTYTVHVMDVECVDQKIEDISGVNSTKPEAVDEIASSQLVTTAVGLVILPRIAPTIAAAIEKRMEQGVKEYMNIIACENAIRGSSQLKAAVYDHLSEEGKKYADEYIGFPDCAVDRIVPPVKSENFIDVVVESYHEWDVERCGFKGEIPKIQGMTVVDNLEAYLERKLFTLNTGHAITAYLGNRKGLSTIDKAIADDEIFAIVSAAMKESGDGLIKSTVLMRRNTALTFRRLSDASKSLSAGRCDPCRTRTPSEAESHRPPDQTADDSRRIWIAGGSSDRRCGSGASL